MKMDVAGPSPRASRGALPRLGAVLDAMPGEIALLGRSGEIRAVNAAWASLDWPGALAGAAFPPGADYPAQLAAIGGEDALRAASGVRAVLGRELPRLTFEHRLSNERWSRLTVTPIYEHDSELEGAVVTHHDVSGPRRAQEDSSASEARLKAIVDNTPSVAIQGYDPDGRVVRWNRGAELIFGFTAEEAIGKTLDQLILTPEATAEFRQIVARILRTQRPEGPAVWQVTAKDGHPRYVYSTIFSIPGDTARGLPPEVVCMDVDITEQKTLEAQLLQSQKMEGIGRLAGGIAHDFNNLLTAIVGCAEITADQLPIDSPPRENVEQILKAGHRAAELTRQLLTFARKQVSQPRVIDLNERIAITERMLRRLIGEDVELVMESGDHLPPVKIDPGQLEQILINMAINARDAMPTGGRLTIETAEVRLRDAARGTRGVVPPGHYARLSVADTGTGMTEEVLGHLFEPFFTTKEPGKGTGLGLATCYGIVQAAGGHILTRSAPMEGTCFEIYLPAAAPSAPAAGAGEQPSPLKTGDETVLLVEDEPVVRDLSTRILETAGHRVLVAPNGREALRLARQHDGPIALLVTDAVMPQMSGEQLAGILQQERPEMGVLLISGYSEQALDEERGFLAKPFTPRTLLARVRELIDARR